MKYIAHLLKNPEYLQKTEEYTKTYFIKKNRHLLDLHQKNIAKTSKDFKNVWSELKVTIWKKQGKRCCLCEKDLTDMYAADVEHYRPKSEYWWLAYDYKNYYLACGECNRKYKGIKFPLLDEAKRVDYISRKNMHEERPLLVNPFFDNPLDYFKLHFRSASNSRNNVMVLVPKGKKCNNYNYQKAKKSIEIYNLDLSDNDQFRLETLRKLFNKLIKVAVYKYIFRKNKNDFIKFYNQFTNDDPERKELRSLGLMRMILKGQFIIDPYILEHYRRQYGI